MPRIPYADKGANKLFDDYSTRDRLKDEEKGMEMQDEVNGDIANALSIDRQESEQSMLKRQRSITKHDL